MSAAEVIARAWPLHHHEARPRHDEPLDRVTWKRLWKNPELAKAVGVFQGYVAEARNLLALPDEEAPLRTDEMRRHVDQLLARDVRRLTIDSAWDAANQLKRDLLLLGDAAYVWTQLHCEAARDRDRWHSWNNHFPQKKLNTLLRARSSPGRKVATAQHLEAVRCLRKLYELRAEAGLDRRARAAEKCRLLSGLLPVLLGLLVALAAAIHEVGDPGAWKAVLLAATAGALGATLSGVRRVRDRLFELDDLRSFRPAMRIQPLIGATAGLVMLLVLESGAMQLGNGHTPTWAARALLTFAAGFSEPFFLGVVERIAVVPDKNATLQTS